MLSGYFYIFWKLTSIQEKETGAFYGSFLWYLNNATRKPVIRVEQGYRAAFEARIKDIKIRLRQSRAIMLLIPT